MIQKTIGGLVAALAAAALPAQDGTDAESRRAQFGDYWYQGQAEVSRYRLTRERYGEMREGHAVLVFVTEPFRVKSQVKADSGDRDGQTETVMKLNRIERFVTGIYDYSLMQSVFVPVEAGAEPAARKVTTSIQDWCGHVWLQLNRQDDGGYRVEGRSYFESEGDEEQKVGRAWLEDALFVRLRLDPESLPTGDLTVLPSTFELQAAPPRPAHVERAGDADEGR